jgi:carbonic anhydrase/acetyltransferase-like protein (isoleucine patch superfamily)
VVFDDARIGKGALVAAGSIVYPRTRVPPHTVFRNGPDGNHPVIEPVGRRLRYWQATTYRRLVATYRASRTVGGRRDGSGARERRSPDG